MREIRFFPKGFPMQPIRSLLVGTVIILTAMIAAPAFAEDQKPTQDQKPAQDPTPLPEISMGKADAPITIVEYSSLSCPHCADFHKNVLPKLKSEYIDTGKVRYVVKEFPLNTPALAGAVVARCLDPMRYIPFIELLFSKQEDWAFKNDALAPLQQLARQAGMTEEQFNKCIDNEDLQTKILATRDQGSKQGVNATPSFFVNGQLLKGVATIETLSEAMKPYLEKKG